MLKKFFKRFFIQAPSILQKNIDEVTAVSKGIQILLALKYKEILNNKGPFPKFEEIEFRAYSQNGEDGILLYIFSLIGTVNKRSLEICCGDGVECNTANLIINHGWTGVMVDGNEKNIKAAINFYNQCRDTKIWPPKFIHAWLDAETVNGLLEKNDVRGEIDLLSIDLDGMDYWIWKAITCVQPRVIVVEYQDILGPEKSVAVPYNPAFVAEDAEKGTNYGGASLKAFTKLAKEKGYRLVGIQRYGYNAFFIKKDIALHILPEIAIEDCFKHDKVLDGIKNRYPLVADRKWIEV